MNEGKMFKLKTSAGLALARSLKELRDQTNAEHDRIHAEAETACQALQQQFKDRASEMFSQIATVEGLPADVDLSAYALDLAYFEEFGDAYLKPFQQPEPFPGLAAFADPDPFDALGRGFPDQTRKH